MTTQRGLDAEDVVVIISEGVNATFSVAFPGYDDLSEAKVYASKEELQANIDDDRDLFREKHAFKKFTHPEGMEVESTGDSLANIASDIPGIASGLFKDAKKRFSSRFLNNDESGTSAKSEK